MQFAIFQELETDHSPCIYTQSPQAFYCMLSPRTLMSGPYSIETISYYLSNNSNYKMETADILRIESVFG